MTVRNGVLRWCPPGLTVDLGISDAAPVRIHGIWPTVTSAAVRYQPAPPPEVVIAPSDPALRLDLIGVPLVELGLVAEGRSGNSAGAQHRLYPAGLTLRYASHSEEQTAGGRTLVLHQRSRSRGLTVSTRLRQFGTTPVLQVVSEVTNTGRGSITLTYLSSLSLTGFTTAPENTTPAETGPNNGPTGTDTNTRPPDTNPDTGPADANQMNAGATVTSPVGGASTASASTASASRASASTASASTASASRTSASRASASAADGWPATPGLRALRLHEARNSWTAELRWQCLSAEQAGLVDIGFHDAPGADTAKARHAVTALGSWSSSDFLPMGGIENTADGLLWVWQIEHHGGWHWEVGDLRGDAYLLASGPTDDEHHWRQVLDPGAHFTTVPVAVAVTPTAAGTAGLACGLRALTDYRRAIRRPSTDHERLPVIFNDYMNCLMGDPSEERLAPLVAAAAQVGAEYFVIDAGWYAEGGGWWETVGAWEPSAARFPSGLSRTLQRIRDAGMLPGLWLEPEVIGVRSPVADELPADAFFTDGGQRRQEHGRFHLDFRSPQVRRRMDAVVDRLVSEYGVRYLKLDYNVDIAPGTDALEASPGAGLLGHNRAYLSWLDGVLDRHPGLVLENCASGGMRMDYALLSRLALQSTSDQTDHLRYAPIAAAAPTAVTPEQGAVWAYPQPGHDSEDASFCLVNALLGRVHLSGRIDLMSDGQRTRVRTAMEVYKQHRALLARGRPQWPLGLPGWYDSWLALAVDDGDDCLLAVWYRGTGSGSITLSLPEQAGPPVGGRVAAGGPRAGHGRTARVLFPTDLPLDLAWSDVEGRLRLSLPGGPAARLIQLSKG